MTVHQRLPLWLCDPCRGYCGEHDEHTHHIKWWVRWLWRLGLVK